MNYVLGFYHDRLSRVLLMRRETAAEAKKDPEKAKQNWQEGLLNALGGKIEPSESPHCAMVREFREEAGIIVPCWRPFCKLLLGEGTVHCFSAMADPAFGSPVVGRMIDGVVDWYQRHTLATRQHPTVDNLNWLIELSLDPRPACAEVIYP